MKKEKFDKLLKMFVGSEKIQKEVLEGEGSQSKAERYKDTVSVMAEHEKELRAPFLPPTRLIKVKKTIEAKGDLVVPNDILDYFLKRASHRFIAHACGCRRISGCKDYPQDLGCMFIGEASKTLPPTFGRSATVEEALEHAQRLREAGLVLHLGYVPYDAALMRVNPANRFMSICGCCPCCCISRFVQYQRMPGVEVQVSESCTGCGICAEKCPSNKIEIVEGKASIDPGCIACGWCVDTCPEGAIEVKVVDPDYIQKTIDWISQKVDVT